MSKLELVKK